MDFGQRRKAHADIFSGFAQRFTFEEKILVLRTKYEYPMAAAAAPVPMMSGLFICTKNKFSAKMQGCKRWLSDFSRVGRFWGGYSCFWVFFSVFG